MVDRKGQGCYESGNSASELYDEGLHGEDDRLVTGPGLPLGVVTGVGQEDGVQNVQETLGHKDEDGRRRQDIDAAGVGQIREQAEQGEAHDSGNNGNIEDISRVEAFPQKREHKAHEDDLHDGAKGVVDQQVAAPVLVSHVILDEIGDEVGRNTISHIDNDRREHDPHSLVIAEQGLEHLADGVRLDLHRGFLLDEDARNHLTDDEDHRNDEGEVLEAQPLIRRIGVGRQRAQSGDGHHSEDDDERLANGGTDPSELGKALPLLTALGEGGDHGPERNVHHGVGDTPEDVERGRVGDESTGAETRRCREHDVQDDAVDDGTQEDPRAEFAPPGPGLGGDNAHERVIEGVEDAGHEQDNAHDRGLDAEDVLEIVQDIGGRQHVADIFAERTDTECRLLSHSQRFLFCNLAHISPHFLQSGKVCFGF